MIELTAECKVASYRNFFNAESPKYILIDERIAYNENGDIILIRQRQRPENDIDPRSEPEFHKWQDRDSSDITTICVDQVNRMPLILPVFAYTGSNFCWVTPFSKDQSVKIFNLRTQKLRVYDPSPALACAAGMNYMVKSCDSVKLLAQGFGQSPNRDTVRRNSSYLQVWNTMDHMLLLDLEKAEPTPMASLSNTLQFTDVNNYVATGFRPAFREVQTKVWKFLEEMRFGNLVLH